ncbi:MAG: rhomboid family intramembrane serine protease [Rhodocyclaceae bacterium]|nr:rhomboid family intramembrane serine protease [Rhodocyclaceae bacterium]
MLQLLSLAAGRDSEPWATRWLVAINLLVFAALAAGVGSLLQIPSAALIEWGGNDGSRTLTGEPWRLLTSVFLHGGLLHVGLNMLALYQAGALVERIYRTPRFLAIYLGAGVIASLSSVWWRQDVVSVGASGAIFGVFGALLSFLAVHRRRLEASVYRRMRAMTLSFVGYSLLLGFAIPGVDNAAHVGGLVAGLALGWLACQWPGRRVIVAGGLAAVLAVVVSLWSTAGPARPPDRALRQFAALQPLLAQRRQEVTTALAAGRLGHDEALAIINGELKPNWDNLIAGLQRQAALGDRHAARLLAYAQLERSSLEALALGLSTGHPAWLGTSAALRVEADRALRDYLASLPRGEPGGER